MAVASPAVRETSYAPGPIDVVMILLELGAVAGAVAAALGAWSPDHGNGSPVWVGGAAGLFIGVQLVLGWRRFTPRADGLHVRSLRGARVHPWAELGTPASRPRGDARPAADRSAYAAARSPAGGSRTRHGLSRYAFITGPAEAGAARWMLGRGLPCCASRGQTTPRLARLPAAFAPAARSVAYEPGSRLPTGFSRADRFLGLRRA
jgi:hypothetical protein